jgi:hypothetical protein
MAHLQGRLYVNAVDLNAVDLDDADLNVVEVIPRQCIGKGG